MQGYRHFHFVAYCTTVKTETHYHSLVVNIGTLDLSEKFLSTKKLWFMKGEFGFLVNFMELLKTVGAIGHLSMKQALCQL